MSTTRERCVSYQEHKFVFILLNNYDIAFMYIDWKHSTVLCSPVWWPLRGSEATAESWSKRHS